MIGIVIVTHARLGDALIEAAQFITGGEIESALAVSIDISQDPEVLRNSISDAIRKVKAGGGVLVLTDMFGGTPSNLSYSFLEEGKIEVISGVNLPILIKAIEKRREKNLSEVAASLEAFGKRSISLASGILKGNKRS
jgi:PTS system mannose-specific IIA component